MSAKELSHKNQAPEKINRTPKPCLLLVNKERNRFKELLLHKKLITTKKPSAKPLLSVRFTKPIEVIERKKEKPSKTIAQKDRPNENLVDAPLIPKIERFVDASSSILADAKIAAHADDDINRLIRKLTLSFTAKKDESRFSIGDGIFKGAQFHLRTHEKKLSLRVSDASFAAKALLLANKKILTDRLLKHEINLSELMV